MPELRVVIHNLTTGELIDQFRVPADKPFWEVPALEPGEYMVTTEMVPDESERQ